MSESIPRQTCSICKESFPLTAEFWHKNRARKCGFCGVCKVCNGIKAKNWRETHHDQFLAFLSGYRQENQNALKEQKRADYTDNKQSIRLRQKVYYDQNADTIRQQKRDYYRENPLKVAIASKRNRILKHAAEGEYSVEDIYTLYDEQEGRCVYCGITLIWDVRGDVHIDHVHPLSRGGSNWPDNLALACKHCNSSKKEKFVQEWMLVRGW